MNPVVGGGHVASWTCRDRKRRVAAPHTPTQGEEKREKREHIGHLAKSKKKEKFLVAALLGMTACDPLEKS